MKRFKDRITLEIANLKEATALIIEKHYLHRGRTMAQLPYWVQLDGARVGVILFAYPRMSVPYQGYGPMELLELARMWIDPSFQEIRIQDSNEKEHTFPIASCAIGKALRRIQNDWQNKYLRLPSVRACVSWADDTYHEGIIYRAANFREVGKTGRRSLRTGRRSDGGRIKPHPDLLHQKTAFLYSLR